MRNNSAYSVEKEMFLLVAINKEDEFAEKHYCMKLLP